MDGQRWTWAVAVSALVLVAACGGDAGPGEPPGDEQTPSATDLAGILVTAEDLGDGWSVDEPPVPQEVPGVVSEEERANLPRIELCDEASDAADAAAEDLRWSAFRQVSFDTGAPREHLVFVQEFLLSDSPATVEETYDALASGIADCVGTAQEYPDGETGESKPLTVPPIGDDRIGQEEIVVEPGGGDQAVWDLRSVLSRDGSVLMGLTVVEIARGSVTPMLDPAAVDDILTTIADKVPPEW